MMDDTMMRPIATTLCLVGSELSQGDRFAPFRSQLEWFRLDIVRCDSAQEAVQRCGDQPGALYVVVDFFGPDFDLLTARNAPRDIAKEMAKPVIGVTALRQYVNDRIEKLYLPRWDRPVHNNAMVGLSLCFASTKDIKKSDMEEWMRLIRYMGAQAREKLCDKTTHLIANKHEGKKYQTAIDTGFPLYIMQSKWIIHSWDNRFDDSFKATYTDVINMFTLKPFTNIFLALVNFGREEVAEMSRITIENEGQIVDAHDPRCTHFVVNGELGRVHFDFNKVDNLADKHVVRTEWFWASIEVGKKMKEKFYPFLDEGSRTNMQMHAGSRMSLDVLSPTGLDYSRSFVDSPCTPVSEVRKPFNFKEASRRHLICRELLETDRRYLAVLRTILTVFRAPLETTASGSRHLDETEIKLIFGKLDPIVEVHEKIVQQLEEMVEVSWKEEACIGKVILDNAQALLRSYPPFINFFENTKEMIVECDAKYPRFHAFLKKCESKPECQRETLIQMIIRPVQRLPSIQLLLKDILKATTKNNPDYQYLTEALNTIVQINTNVNEEKRTTEGQLAMFDVIHDIKDCPPVLLSSNRKLICQVDAKLLLRDESDSIFALKSHLLTLFLFSDALEICEKKQGIKRSDSKRSDTNASRNTVVKGQLTPSSVKAGCKQTHRHVELLFLNRIRSMYYFDESHQVSEYDGAVLLESTQCTERSFKIYPFLIEDRGARKDFIALLQERIFKGNDKENVADMQQSIMHRLKNLDYTHAEQLAAALFKRSTFGKARATISRALSMRALSTSLTKRKRVKEETD